MKQYKNAGAFMLGVDRLVAVSEDGLGDVSDARLRERIAERLAVRAPGADEVLLRVEYVGVCGSDVHYFHAGRCGAFAVDPERDIPYVLGHECAGTVVEVGENVKNLAVGDRVCCEPGVPCGHCEQCRSGHYNLCPDVVFWATPPVQGCYERYVPFRADFCFKLPENVSTRAGALAEPFAIGMYAAELGEVTVGSTVAILGSGCIGLMTLLACRARGAKEIIVTDLEDVRLEKARELGADRVVNTRRCDALAAIDEYTHGRGVDVVFETAGSRVTIGQTPFAARLGGLVVLVGISPEEELPYNFGQVMAKELRIKSVFRYVNMFPKTVAAIAAGAPVEQVVTHEYALEDIQQAFDDSVHRKNEVVKAIIRI